MLKINLLPDSARRATLSPIEQFHRTPLMWMAGIIMIAIPIALWVPVYLRSRQLQALNAKIQVLEPKKAEVERLQRTLQDLRAQQAAFEGMSKKQGLWSKRLSILSNLTPAGVWFTDLMLDEARGLIIQGSGIGQGDPELASVTRLVTELKKDTDFTAAFKNISIESIKTVQEGELEIVQFRLTCSPQEGPPKL